MRELDDRAGLSAAQLLQRETAVGASEVAATLELHPHQGPNEVWARKRTPTRGPLLGQQRAGYLDVGNALEGAVLRLYQDRTGRSVQRPTESRTHGLAPHVLATPDGIIDAPGAPRRLAQVKVVGASQMRLWRSGVPDHVRLQVAQEMAVWGAAACDVAALIGGTDFEVFPVPREIGLEQSLLDHVERWWTTYVDGDEPPEELPAWLRRRRLLEAHPEPDDDKPEGTVDEDIMLAAHWIVSARATMKVAEEQLDLLEASLAERIGERYGFTGYWGSALLYAQRGRVNWKAVAEELNGGPIDESVSDRHRGAATRVLRVTGPKLQKQLEAKQARKSKGDGR